MQLNIHNFNIKDILLVLEKDIINYGSINLYLDIDDVLILNGKSTNFMLHISKLKNKYLDRLNINVLTGRSNKYNDTNCIFLSEDYRKLLIDNLLISNENIFCGFFTFLINTDISLDINEYLNKLNNRDVVTYFFDDRIKLDSYLHVDATKSLICKKYASVCVNLHKDSYLTLYN